MHRPNSSLNGPNALLTRAALKDTSSLMLLKARALNSIEENDHQLLVLSQKMAQREEDKAHLSSTWVKKKQVGY